MSQIKQITHIGRVSHIDDKKIIVDIERSSACAACHSKAACTILDSQTQQIHCPNEGYNFKIGDMVTLTLEKSLGARAVALAFIIPLILLILFIIIVTDFLNLSQGAAALIGLAAVAVYYIVLHFFNDKLESKFKFKIIEN